MLDSTQQPSAVDPVDPPPTGEPAIEFPITSYFERTDWLSFLAAAAATLAVYLFTLAPDVTLENSGTLATGAAYGGVAYPPGYPLWTVYSWLLTRLLPISTIAWRIGCGSAVAASLSCGLVALMVSRGGRILLENMPLFARWTERDQNRLRIVCGCVAGLALGLSGSVWRKAVIVDVWTFGLLLFTTLLCLFMRWLAAPAEKRFLYRACLILGLMLTGNWEMLLLIPAFPLIVFLGNQKLGRDLFLATAILVVLAWLGNKFGPPTVISTFAPHAPILKFLGILILPTMAATVTSIILTRRAGSEWKAAACCLLFFFLGLASWFYLPVVSMTDPPMNWAYPRTVDGFYHCITRGQYDHVYPTTEFRRYAMQLWALTKDTGIAFGWQYLCFALLPFCLVHRMHRDSRKWLACLATVFIYVGPLMICMLNPEKDRQSLELHRPYWYAAYAVLAIWTGLGMMLFAGFVSKTATQPAS